MSETKLFQKTSYINSSIAKWKLQTVNMVHQHSEIWFDAEAMLSIFLQAAFDKY